MTNSVQLADTMELSWCTRNPVKMKNKSIGSWYYEQIELGFNYRMTDIQAALGSSQINRLDTYISCRTDIAEWYDNKFQNMGVTPLTKKNRKKFSAPPLCSDS
jgi:dTDP-4-amino-4,6-dideoxygalactose transaminase